MRYIHSNHRSVESNMLCQLHTIVGVFVAFAAVVAVSQAAPECRDDVCLERQMHPDMPELSRSQMYRVEGEETIEFWRSQSNEFIRTKLAAEPNVKKAKNVIMFLGDGMGVTTTSAARLLLGGEEKELSFEKFPYVGLSKTYAIDRIVPDSACTATAYLCGVKAQEGTLGVSGAVPRTDCTAGLDTSTHVDSIAQWAMDEGKWAGIVTTTRITHASPAGAYAHIAERDWENDMKVAQDCGDNSNIQDIAYQLMRGETGSQFKLILGGGRRNFRDSSKATGGIRTDGLDLIDEFEKAHEQNVYVSNREELLNVDVTKTERLLGLFQDDHLRYRLDVDEDSTQPTLEEMTRKAIEMMSQNDEGYFLFIEGGRIDHAHHDTFARKALNETIEFSNAIAAALEITDEEDTLIVVTADHSHTLSYSGYPYRGNDIFGTAPSNGNDGKPYMTLSYANGPSYDKFFKSGERVDPTTLITGDVNDEFPSGLSLEDETHGGDDVLVYANGPWSHLFTGVYEQSTIPHMMAYASCLGTGLTLCNEVDANA